MSYSTRFQSSSASASSLALEQSNADLTLLNQSLGKSKRITDRFTTLLTGFDDRLARLEKSLVPIHRQTGRLTRMSKNIEATLRSVDGLLGHQDLVEREKPLISAGPNQMDLKPYLAAMDRLTSATEALKKTDAKSTTLAQMSLLIDSGARQLAQVFVQWVRDTSPTMDAAALLDEQKPFPSLSSYFVDNATPLYAYLRALPDIGSKITKDIELSYAEVRATFMENALKQCGKDVLVDATPAQAGTAALGRRGLGRFLDALFALAKSEYALIGVVFPAASASRRKDIYAALLPNSLAIFTTTGQQLNALVKKNLHSLVSIAFASFADLQDRTPEFEEWIRAKAGRKENEVGELQHAFRGSCLTSLPEFIDDTKSWGNKPPSAQDLSAVKVNLMTINVVTFMRQLSDNQTTAESFLTVLGPGNWGGSQTKSPVSGSDDDETLLTRYLNDVVAVLMTALETRSRVMRQRSFGAAAIFLLNNVSYVRREASNIGDVLGETCQDLLNKKMRSAKAMYLEIWSPLVSALLDAGLDQSGAAGAIKAGLGAVKGGADRRETKDRFVRFTDAFEEVESLHQTARLDEGEADMRERLKGEVERMILPTYSKFLAKHRNGEFSKNASKYLKLDAEQLTERMNAIFD